MMHFIHIMMTNNCIIVVEDTVFLWKPRDWQASNTNTCSIIIHTTNELLAIYHKRIVSDADNDDDTYVNNDHLRQLHRENQQ